MFPSLVGRLTTNTKAASPSKFHGFPSLVGRLTTGPVNQWDMDWFKFPSLVGRLTTETLCSVKTQDIGFHPS